MHRPVMVAEVLELLGVERGGVFVDCTVGEGGHALAIMERAGAGSKLVGLDWDEDALRVAGERLRRFGDHVVLQRSSFSRLGEVLAEVGVRTVDGVLFDLGVSSPQLDVAERGFGYQQPGLLDMRMDRRRTVTAADLVNQLPGPELTRIIATFGEERWADRIARAIVHRRARRPLLTTQDLVETIKEAIPAPARRRGGHPARRTFQALRIAVNQELDELAAGLEQAIQICRPGGRVCVISFHSLEDRLVKHRFAALHGSRQGRILTKRPRRPTPAEVAENPRSRSARLRAVELLPGRIGTEEEE